MTMNEALSALALLAAFLVYKVNQQTPPGYALDSSTPPSAAAANISVETNPAPIALPSGGVSPQ